MATYTGTSGDDTFTGSSENDTASGGAGRDFLSGGGGDDTLYSGAASPAFSLPYMGGAYVLPQMDTGTEVDTLSGGDGFDYLFAGFGDNVDGGAGYDLGYISLQGATAGVTVEFGSAPVSLGGGTITGVETYHYVQGSQFGDNLTLTNGRVVSGMDGNDTLTGGDSTYALLGDAGDDVIDARAARMEDVVVYGGDGADTIYTGDRTFSTAYGGAGDDTIYGSGAVDAGPGNDTVTMQLSTFAETVYGGDGDDSITAGFNGNAITGGKGGDTLIGAEGDDVLASGDRDPVTGQTDDMGLEHDVVAAGRGDDTVEVGYGDDADGGSNYEGGDTLFLSLGGVDHGMQFNTAGLVGGAPVALGGGVIQNFEHLAYLRGTEFADSLDLATQADVLRVDAGAGDDTITAHDGTTSVLGGAGNDLFVSGTAADRFDGGAGSDTVDYRAATTGVTVDLASGTGGDDTLISVENVTGSAFADTLTGDAGANVLNGGNGDDRLNGARGDTLTGGAGRDTFVFSQAAPARIYATDFAVGTDKIDISALLKQAGYTGNDPVREGYMAVSSDGADGTELVLKAEPYSGGPALLVLDLAHVSPNGLTWQQLSGQPTIGFPVMAIGHSEGNSGATAYNYTVNRTGDLSNPSSVHWTVGGTGAHPADGADFVGGALPSGDLTFAAGETSKTLTVSVAGDTAVEADESFSVTLSSATNGVIGNATVPGGITNDDAVAAGQVYTADHIRSSIAAGAGSDTINGSEAGDTLTGGAGSDLFHFGTKPWEPTHITDFTVGADKLDLSALLQQAGYTGSNPVADQYISFADNGAGGTKVLFDRDGSATGQQWPDRIIELDNLAYNPANSSQILGASVGNGASQPVVGFSAAEGLISHNEGNSGWTPYTWTVTRTGDTSGSSSVSWSTSGSGASPASSADIATTQSSGTLTFGPGETSKTITVYANGDTAPEADEDFTVTLSGPAGATLGDSTRVGRILNDDTAPSNGSSGQVFTANQPHSTVVGTSYSDTINGSQAGDTLTGGAGADLFRFASKPWEPTHITDFAVGQDKLDLSALLQQVGYTGSDPIGDKYIQFADNGAGGTKVLFDRDGVATGQQWPDRILELDNLTYNPANASQMLGTSVGGSSGGGAGGSTSTVIALESKTTTQAEGNSGLSIYSYTLTRSGDLSHTSSVGWAVTGSGANPANAADFENGALPSGNFIFAAGEASKQIFVKVAGDTTTESDEQFTVTLSGPSGATLGNATAQGVITNDDAAPGGGTGGTSGQVYTASDVHSTMSGTAGNDTFNASQAADTITGGAGADLFHFGSKPWEPAHITDFQVGADKLDLSALLQQVGYAGSDPLADQYIQFADNGAGGTKVLFDRDGAATGQQWPDRIIELDHLAYNPANSSQILGTSVSGSTGGSTGGATGGSTGGGSTGGGSTSGSAGQVFTSPGPETVATGTAGNDTFNASQGADTLTGGGGADVFNLPTEPWSPIHITDFTPGTDKIDLSHLLKAVGYAGTDPVADHYIYIGSDGADGSIIRFDRDGAGPNPQWPNTIIDLEHVAPAQVSSSDWIVG